MSQDRARAARYVITRRGELGLTQQQLAELAGIDIKTVYNLESGERWPQVRTRVKIETALGWVAGSLEALATGREPGYQYATMAELLEDGRTRRALSESEAAALAGLTEDQWRDLVFGSASIGEARKPDPSTASLVARAAQVVRVTPEQLAEAGREDAATELRQMIRRDLADSGSAADAITVERKYDEPWKQVIWENEHLTEQERRVAIIAVQAYRQGRENHADAQDRSA